LSLAPCPEGGSGGSGSSGGSGGYGESRGRNTAPLFLIAYALYCIYGFQNKISTFYNFVNAEKKIWPL